MDDNIVETRGKLLGFTIHDDRTFEERQAAFIAGLRRDSLAAGAIPNPHARVGIPKVKFMRLLINGMFSRGLPKGWGK